MDKCFKHDRAFLTSSAANFKTAVKGVSSGTLRLIQHKQERMRIKKRRDSHPFDQRSEHSYRYNKIITYTYTLNGNFGSEVRVILNVTFDLNEIEKALKMF